MSHSVGARANNMDAIRLLLAASVILSHSYPLATGNHDGEPIHWLTMGQSTIGSIAVDCFFILSGYLIAQSWLRSSSAKSYFAKRIKRIVPAFLVAATISAFIIAPLYGGHSLDVVQYLKQVVRLRPYEPPGTFASNPFPGAANGSLWTIYYEFACYVGVAIMGVMGLLGRKRLTLALWIASIILGSAYLYTGRHDWQFANWARLLPCYLSGVVFFLYRDRISLNGRGAMAALLALCIAARIPHAWAATAPIAIAYLVLWASFTPVMRVHNAGKFGDFSYGTYLWAFPVQQMIAYHFGPIDPLPMTVMAVVFTAPLAFASWHLAEKPFLKRRETDQTASQPVALSRA